MSATGIVILSIVCLGVGGIVGAGVYEYLVMRAARPLRIIEDGFGIPYYLQSLGLEGAVVYPKSGVLNKHSERLTLEKMQQRFPAYAAEWEARKEVKP